VNNKQDKTIIEAARLIHDAKRISSVANSPILSDTVHVLYDSIPGLGSSKEPTPSKKHLEIPDLDKQGTCKRGFKVVVIMVIITIWTMLLSAGFTILFHVLNQNNNSLVASLCDSLTKGLSGGAFLATIAGTMIPKIQQDAYRSFWRSDTSKLVGLIIFECGLLTAVIIDVIL